MAYCETCGWHGEPDDCRTVLSVDPGLCPNCLSVHTRRDDDPDEVAGDVQGDADG